MSFTTGTPNYGLPQYKGTDMPSWQTDMTNAFKKIDEIMGDVGSESSGAATDVANLKTEVNTLKTQTNQTTQNLETLTTTVNTNQTNNQQAINGLDTRITVEHNVNTTQTEAINQIQGQLENIPDAETLASLTGDVATLKEEVGTEDISSISTTLTGGLVVLNEQQGIETRVDPEDSTKVQWRAKGSTSEDDWVNFSKGEAILIGTLSPSRLSIQNDLLIGKTSSNLFQQLLNIQIKASQATSQWYDVIIPQGGVKINGTTGTVSVNNALSFQTDSSPAGASLKISGVKIYYVESKTG